MGPEWNFPLVIPPFYQASCFWVMESVASFLVTRQRPGSIHSTGLLVPLVSESSSAASTFHSAFTRDTKTSYPVPIPTAMSAYLFFTCLSVTSASVWFFLSPWAFDQLVRHCPWVRIQSIPVSISLFRPSGQPDAQRGYFPPPCLSGTFLIGVMMLQPSTSSWCQHVVQNL